MVGTLGVAVALVSRVGGDPPRSPRPVAGGSPPPAAVTTESIGTEAAPPQRTVVVLDRIPKPRKGIARILTAGRAATRAVAYTFDDGYCPSCVGALVTAVERTGAHVTFCPNGIYGSIWERYRKRIRALIETGTVTICNHTWSHSDLRQLDRSTISTEISRNEAWIERTFGVTSRPYLRPPYGAYNDLVLEVAGELGFTRIAMWSGTLADSTQQTRRYLVNAAKHWSKPGAIILAHGNHPGTGGAFPRIVRYLNDHDLRTATLTEIDR